MMVAREFAIATSTSVSVERDAEDHIPPSSNLELPLEQSPSI